MIQATDVLVGSQVQLLTGVSGVLGMGLIAVLGYFLREFAESFKEHRKEMTAGLANLAREFADHRLHSAETYVPKREFRRLEDRMRALENTGGWVIPPDPESGAHERAR